MGLGELLKIIKVMPVILTFPRLEFKICDVKNAIEKVTDLSDKISHALTYKPKLVVLFAVLLLIPSFLGMVATRINYDILTYLPSDLDSTRGEALLEEPFKSAATTMLIVEDMPPEYTNELRKKIADVPGVSNVVWLSSLVGIQIPTDMFTEELRDKFYSGDSTIMIIQYDMPGASEETMAAIDSIRRLVNKQCFLAGFSVLIKDTKDLVDSELPVYVTLAVIFSYIAMSLTMDSWLLPVALLLGTGLAIMYNMGTNIFLGEISYVTNAIAAVLQLGVTMDYSIFIYSRYKEEQSNYKDNREAMAKAISSSFVALMSSSLTTIAGFVALCFMRLRLGLDIGIVMAKGVAIGIITSICVLPSILLQMDKYIDKFRHKTLLPDMSGLARFTVKHRKLFIILFLLMYIPAFYAQDHAPLYYNLDRSLPQDMPSIVATNKLKSDYNMSTIHFIILKDDLSAAKVRQMTEEIENVKGIESVIAYNKFINAVPDFFVPKEIRDIFKKGGYQLVMITSAYDTATDEVAQQIDQIEKIVEAYDPDAAITGEAVLSKDLINVADEDFRVTGYISVILFLLVVAVLFKSASIPFIIGVSIELAIFINEGIPYFTANPIPFIAPIVISCVQLGATCDYADLMISRFQEEIQKGRGRIEAMEIAAAASYGSIITSSLVLFCATFGVAMISKIEIISSMCLLLARGALISAAIVIFILPAILAACEPLVAKTTRWWRTPKPPKAQKAQADGKLSAV